MMPVGARSCTSWPAAVHLSAKPACFAQGGDSFLVVPEEVAKQSVLLGHLVLFFPSVLQCLLQPLILFHVVDTGIL